MSVSFIKSYLTDLQFVNQELIRVDGDVTLIKEDSFERLSKIGASFSEVLDLSYFLLTDVKIKEIAKTFTQVQQIDVTGCTFNGQLLTDTSKIAALFSPRQVEVIMTPAIPSVGALNAAFSGMELAPSSSKSAVAPVSSSSSRAVPSAAEVAAKAAAAMATAAPGSSSSSSAASFTAATDSALKMKKVRQKKNVLSAAPKKVSPNRQTFMERLGPNPPAKNVTAIDLRKMTVVGIDDWAEILCTEYPGLYFVYLPIAAKLTLEVGRTLKNGLKHLSGLDIAVCDKKDLQGLQELPMLLELHNVRFLESEQLEFLSDEALERCIQTYCTESSQLASSIVKNDQFDPRAIDAIKAMKGLQILRLGAVNIGDRALVQFTTLSKLKEFSLSSTAITSVGIHNLRNATALTKLHLNNCPKLDDAALKLIVKQFPDLTDLSVESSDSSRYLFTALSQLKNLRRLMVSCFKKVHYSDWMNLGSSCPLLEELVVTHADEITDSVFLSWKSMKSLKFCKVKAKKLQITAQARESFQVSLPFGGCVSLKQMETRAEIKAQMRQKSTGLAVLKRLQQQNAKEAGLEMRLTAKVKELDEAKGHKPAHRSSSDGLLSFTNHFSVGSMVIHPRPLKALTAAELVDLEKEEVGNVRILATIVSYIAATSIYIAQNKMGDRFDETQQFISTAQFPFVVSERQKALYFKLFSCAISPVGSEQALQRVVVSAGQKKSAFDMAKESVDTKAVTTVDLRKMVVSGDFIENLTKLRQRYPNIQMLHLPCNVSLTAQLGQLLATFTCLEALDISFCKKDDLAAFRYLPKLKALYSQTPFEEFDALFIKGYSGVDETRLPQNWEALPLEMITDSQVQNLVGLTNLEVLALGKSSISKPLIKALHPLVRLKKLNIEGCTNLSNGSMRCISEQFQELEEFICGNNLIGDTGMGYLAQMPRLHTLTIGDQPEVTAAGIEKIGACKGLRRLLIVRTAVVTDKALISIAGCLKKLEIFNIANSGRYDARIIGEIRKKLPLNCTMEVDGIQVEHAKLSF